MIYTAQMITPSYIHALIAEALQTEPLDESQVASQADCTLRQWRAFVQALRSYRLVKISGEQWAYWQNSLPPKVSTATYFLQAEGAELPTLFFQHAGAYYALRMRHSDPQAQARIEVEEAEAARWTNPRLATVYMEWRHGSGTPAFYFSCCTSADLLDEDIITTLLDAGFTRSAPLLFQAPTALDEGAVVALAKAGRFGVEFYRPLP